MKFLNLLINFLVIGLVNAQNILELPRVFANPGDSDRIISLNLTNSDAIGGIQFAVTFDTTLVAFTNVTAADRLPLGFSIGRNIVADSLKVVIFSLTGDSIPPGSGEILDLHFDVSSSAQDGDSTVLNFAKIVLSSPQNQQLPDSSVNGVIYVTTASRIGEFLGSLTFAHDLLVIPGQKIIIHTIGKLSRVLVFDNAGRLIKDWLVKVKFGRVILIPRGSSGVYYVFLMRDKGYTVRKVVIFGR